MPKAKPPGVDRPVTPLQLVDSPIDRAFRAVDTGMAGQRTHDQIARDLVRAYQAESGAAVIATEGKLWRYDDGLYRAFSVDQINMEVAQRYSSEKLCRKTADYRGIAEHVLRIADDPEFFRVAPSGVCTQKSFYRITPSGEQKEKLSADLRQRYALPCEPDFVADRPLVDEFLRRAFAGDEADAQISRAGEVIGAVLSGALPLLQKAILCLGPSFTSKSAFVEIVTALVPDEFVSSTPPDRWGHEYYLASLAGKRLNVVGESEVTRPIPGAPFKRVTGGDRLQGRHPNHRPHEFYNSAAHIFLANNPPHTEDRSDSFFRRWEILHFANVVRSDEVRPGFAKLLVDNELPQLLALAIDGAVRLARQKAFTPSERHRKLLLKWRMSASSVLEFLHDADVCTLQADASCPQLDLFRAYQQWAADAGRRPIGRNSFYQDVDDNGGAVGIRRATGHAGKGIVHGVELSHSVGW